MVWEDKKGVKNPAQVWLGLFGKKAEDLCLKDQGNLPGGGERKGLSADILGNEMSSGARCPYVI